VAVGVFVPLWDLHLVQLVVSPVAVLAVLMLCVMMLRCGFYHILRLVFSSSCSPQREIAGPGQPAVVACLHQLPVDSVREKARLIPLVKQSLGLAFNF